MRKICASTAGMASRGERGTSVPCDRNHSGAASGEEAPRLRTLKCSRSAGSAHPGYVGPTGTVLPTAIVFLPRRRSACRPRCTCMGNGVRIVAGRYEAEHPRKFSAQEIPSLPEHRAAMVAAVSGKRGKRYLKRQQLLSWRAGDSLSHGDRASPTPAVVRGCRSTAPASAEPRPEVVRRAMEEGLKQQIFGAFYVERSLQPG